MGTEGGNGALSVEGDLVGYTRMLLVLILEFESHHGEVLNLLAKIMK